MHILVLLLGLLPPSRLKNRILNLAGRGYNIAPTAKILPCVLWRVRRLEVGEGAYLGAGTTYRGMRRISIGAGAGIGQLNDVTGVAKWVDQEEPAMAGTLVLEKEAAVTSRHLLECSGGIAIDELAVIGGFRSLLISRGMDVENGHQQARPIRIGKRTLVAATVTILPGVSIVDHCVVAAGSVVPKDLNDPWKLYAGNPAKPVRPLGEAAFLRRTGIRIISAAQRREAQRAADEI